MVRSFALLSLASAADVRLATFDGAEQTTASWKLTNDPVMGGKTTSSFDEATATFEGTCAIVPSLSAPGFAKIVGSRAFADITNFDTMTLKVKSSTPTYAGFKLAFAAPGVPKTSIFGGGSYKAGFTLKDTQDWQVVEVPYTQFSYDWSGYTGRCDTQDPGIFGSKGQQHYCCDKSGIEPSKPEVCIDSKYLSEVNDLEVWAEGVEGDFNIQLEYIGASSSSLALKTASAGNLVTFDGAEQTSFTFKILNDPVMGGKSTGSWSLGSGFGILDGEVVDVPSLSAPGFIKAAGDGKFPDISAFADGSLVLSVRTSTPDYAGYRVTVVSGAVSADFACAGGGSLPFSRGCYKEKFSVPAGSEFVDVKIPFSRFSDKWSSATGEHTAECADDSSTCLTAAKLSKIRRVEFWGEGANGKLHLEVQSVSAESASGERLVLA